LPAIAGSHHDAIAVQPERPPSLTEAIIDAKARKNLSLEMQVQVQPAVVKNTK
jgi:hypothetical protein